MEYYPKSGEWKGTMDTAVYAATFKHGEDDKETGYASYTFPNYNSSVSNFKEEKWFNEGTKRETVISSSR